MCLPKVNHIVSVVPNPNLAHLKQLEAELKTFIFDNNPNVVDNQFASDQQRGRYSALLVSQPIGKLHLARTF